MTPEELANAAIERLAEDEALRGDLTDDGYMPLQAWAFDQLTRLTHEVAQVPDPAAAMDAASTAVRETLAAAVAAAESGHLADLTKWVQPPVIADHAVPAVREAIQQLALGVDADANASAIAAALAVGIPRASAAPREDAVAPPAAPASDPAWEMTDVPGTAGAPTPPAPAAAEADCEEA